MQYYYYTASGIVVKRRCGIRAARENLARDDVGRSREGGRGQQYNDPRLGDLARGNAPRPPMDSVPRGRR